MKERVCQCQARAMWNQAISLPALSVFTQIPDKALQLGQVDNAVSFVKVLKNYFCMIAKISYNFGKIHSRD